MTRIHTRPYLIDGPLSQSLLPSHGDVARAMAADLVKANAYSEHADAFRCLIAEGYSALYIVLCIDDARQIAAQDVVAKEMGES